MRFAAPADVQVALDDPSVVGRGPDALAELCQPPCASRRRRAGRAAFPFDASIASSRYDTSAAAIGTPSSRAPLVVSLSYDILQFSARPVMANDPHATPPAGSIFARPRPPRRTGVQGIVSKVTLGSGAQEPHDGVEVRATREEERRRRVPRVAQPQLLRDRLRPWAGSGGRRSPRSGAARSAPP